MKVSLLALGAPFLLVLACGGEDAHTAGVNTGSTPCEEKVAPNDQCPATWAATIDAGFGGLECLSGIPGSTGATPVQNVGAYGVEVSDTLTRVRLLDRRTGGVDWVAADRLGLAYRTSVPKGSAEAVVLDVEFALEAGGRSAPLRYGELSRAVGVQPGERTDPVRVRDAVLALWRTVFG